MLILGHRGAIIGRDTSFSQNGLRAFMRGLNDGDGIETDACLTKDGEVFLIHEAKYVDPSKGVEYCMGEYLDDASAKELGKRRIDELTAEQVRCLRLKNGEPLPYLRDILKIVGAQKGKILDIELKAFNVVGPVMNLLQESFDAKIITPDAIVISSFNHYALLTARQKMPKIKIGALFIDDQQPTKPLFPWHPESSAAYTSLTSEALRNPLLKQIDPDFFIMPQEFLSEKVATMIAKMFPRAELMAWIFTEKNNFDPHEFVARLGQVKSAHIAAMIVDEPHAFVKLMQGFSKA